MDADYNLSPINTGSRGWECESSDANFIVFMMDAMLMMSRSTDAMGRDGVE